MIRQLLATLSIAAALALSSLCVASAPPDPGCAVGVVATAP